MAEFSRRQFLKLGTGGLLGLYVGSRFGGFGATPVAVAVPIPGGTLDPLAVPKFQTPLFIPPVMPRAGTIKLKGGKNADYYEISVRQFAEQILPAGMPTTTVWGYGAVKGMGMNPLLIHNAPSLTIEAQVNRPVRVKWINELKAAAGGYLPHLLPVDPTLHWANPPGGMDGRDTRPDFTGQATPGSYTGPVPMVPHLHGASASATRATVTPRPGTCRLPRTSRRAIATDGTWYDFFAAKALNSYGAEWGPGYATFQYPNENRASTIWYHDHALGMTRLNVYAGPAGFYIVRGGPAGDGAVLDSRFGTRAVLPGPAPKEGDKFPPNKTYYEIPIAIQDRAFDADGSLFYPDTREFFDGATADDPGYIPDSDLSPIWNPEFFGNMIMVNGNTWPFQTVEKRRYRFRFLNGCQSRFLILDFRSIPGVEVWQIGNEGGFLAAPVNLTGTLGNRLLMGLAERADLIVDFTNVPVGELRAGQRRTGRAVRRRRSGRPAFPKADPDTTGQIMEFRVIGPRSRPIPPRRRSSSSCRRSRRCRRRPTTRRLALLEMMSMAWDGPAEAMLGTVDADGMPMHSMWSEPVTENPAVGDTEVWEFYNFTADAHPMHVHEVVFEVVDRQSLETNEDGETVPPAQAGRRSATTRALGERVQGHGDRLPGRSHPRRARSSTSRASSSGTATSSSTRTTR